MLKIKHQNRSKVILQRLRTTPVLAVASLLLVSGSLTHGFGVFAATCSSNSDCQAQINDLSSKNGQAKDALTGLQSTAGGYQDAINKLQAQISGVQSQIIANQNRQADLQAQIVKAQQEIDYQKGVLGNSVKTMYLSGQLTPQEMLATSDSLSDYIDKQQAYSVVQDKIQQTLKQIAALQNELNRQKTEVETLIASQKTQQAQLNQAQAEQASLLAYNQDQQNAYNAQISSNSKAIGQLRQQQIILNTKYNLGPAGTGVNCGGGYPAKWCNIAQDSVIDSWGMYNRECVSYTAFMVHQDFLEGRNSRDMPYWGGVGNANQWDDNARRAGIPVDTNPTVGSIAISNSGYYGHAMYVAAVRGDTIYVKQYNAGLDGRYTEVWRYTTGLVFIHF